jgi:signal transduction histidine kinase
MRCHKCAGENSDDADRCNACSASLAIATLEVCQGGAPEKIFFLKPRDYTVGRGRHNDFVLSESSISKSHGRICFSEGRFVVEDTASTHGIYVDGKKIDRARLESGSELQLGSLTLRFQNLGESSTDQVVHFPWIEQQQLLLSMVQTLNSTLVLSEVLDQVLAGVMRMTRAERGFVLLTEEVSSDATQRNVAGLRLRLGRQRDTDIPLTDASGISSSVVRRVLQGGQTVATGNAVADPKLSHAQSVAGLELRTIVCVPLRSHRVGDGDKAQLLGAIYVDNPHTSAPFRPESLAAAEALARHAALAIENAQLFEREQKAHEELRVAQKRLLQAEKLATIGQMSAGIAHELNTPLTYIMGNLELLQQAPELSEPHLESLRSIGRGAERISNLAQSLLAFSRPSAEMPQPLDVNEVIARALELCHYHILKGGVTLKTQLDAGLPRVTGTASQLEMALINLVVNAVHAMDGEGQLTVGSRTKGQDEIEISVADTGPGIPEAIRGSLFEPFVTTKPEGKGTGLGLSTVWMVVERHGGRIDFATETSVGTTFRIALPVRGAG